VRGENKMEKNLRKNNGITLVALVITIIILLILAGVAIVTLTQTGLFEKAKQAKNMTYNAYEKENAILGEYSNKIDETVDGTRQDDNILKIFSKVEGTEEIQKFEYTGDYQEFTARQDGYYKIECWGAGGYKDSGYAGRKTEKVHILQVLYI